jgi:hypothetical protein
LNIKKLVPLLATVILFLGSTNLSTVAYSQTEERKVCYSLNRGGLLIEIIAPIQAWPGDTINITINGEASTEIYIEFINAAISCLKDNLTETSIGTINFLENFDFSSGENYNQHYEVAIPEDALPGLIYGKLQYRWYIKGDIRTYVDDVDAFQVTFVQNKAYEELRQAYDALNSFAEDLQANYTSLEANYTDLQQKYQQIADSQIAQDNATGLMYLFIITTGIFVVTTALLIIRRPKTATW